MATDRAIQLSDISAILVTLSVGEEQVLFAMLASDGGINRLGTGSENNQEHTMCIGKTDPSCFHELCSTVTPELLQFCGRSLADPKPKGKRCQLTLGFKQVDGKELMMGFVYGSQSQSPPPAVCKFVLATVKATDTWYEEQKTMIRQNERNKGE